MAPTPLDDRSPAGAGQVLVADRLLIRSNQIASEQQANPESLGSRGAQLQFADSECGVGQGWVGTLRGLFVFCGLHRSIIGPGIGQMQLTMNSVDKCEWVIRVDFGGRLQLHGVALGLDPLEELGVFPSEVAADLVGGAELAH